MELFKITYDMISQGNIDLLKIYLNQGKMTDSKFINGKFLWFGEAIVLSDNPENLEELLKYKDTFFMTNNLKQNLSHLICIYNKPNSLKMMLTLFNNIYYIDDKDKYGKTPLSYALENDNLEMVKLLISFNCNLDNLREYSSNESLIYLKKLIELEELTFNQQMIIYLLIKNNADFHRINFWNENADNYFIILQHRKKISDYVMNLITTFLKEKDEMINNAM